MQSDRERGADVWCDKIIAAHRSVTDCVSHGSRLKSDRYFVWQEQRGADAIADNRHAETGRAGVTDLFSKLEFDPWADEIGEAFDNAGISWELVLVEFEPDTGFWHWSFDWQVC